MADFSTLLARHRAEAGLSMSALADLAGFHQTYVGQLERGIKEPSRPTVLALAEVLCLNVSQTDRLLLSAEYAPRTDYQRLWESEHGAIDEQRKWCPGCTEPVPVSRFSRDRTQRDGLQARCKSCRAVIQGRWRTRAALRGAGRAS